MSKFVDIAVGVDVGGVNDPDVISVVGREESGQLRLIAETIHPSVELSSLAHELGVLLRSYDPEPMLVIDITGAGEHLQWLMKNVTGWKRFYRTKHFAGGQMESREGFWWGLASGPIVKDWLRRAVASGQLAGPISFVENWEALAMAGFALTEFPAVELKEAR